MPLASLSTFAVMKPGPTTAKNSRSRNFQDLRNFMRTGHRMVQIDENRTIRINAERVFRVDESANARKFCRFARVGRLRSCRAGALARPGRAQLGSYPHSPGRLRKMSTLHLILGGAASQRRGLGWRSISALRFWVAQRFSAAVSALL